MSTAEIRMQLVGKIMQLSDQALLRYKKLFEREETADNEILTEEQHDDLMERVKRRRNGEGKTYNIDEFKTEIRKRLA